MSNQKRQDSSLPILQPVVRSLHQAPAAVCMYDSCLHVRQKTNTLQQEAACPGMSMIDVQHERTIACTTALLSHPYRVSGRCSCTVCCTNWPSDFYLSLHITEAHDKFFESSVQSGKSCNFCCLVRSCRKRFKTTAERRQHLQTAHLYAAEANFHAMHLRQVNIQCKSHNCTGRNLVGDVTGHTMPSHGVLQSHEKRQDKFSVHIKQRAKERCIRNAPAFPSAKRAHTAEHTEHVSSQSSVQASHLSKTQSNDERASVEPETLQQDSVLSQTTIHPPIRTVASFGESPGQDVETVDDLALQFSAMSTQFVPRSVQIAKKAV